MRTFRLRRKLTHLIGLLLCCFLAIQFISVSFGSYEREVKDSPNLALPTSLDPWNIETRGEGEGRKNVGRDLNLFRAGLLEQARSYEDKNLISETLEESKKDEHIESLQASKRAPSTIRRFSRVPPAALQEETCPGCYGTSLCDKFYAGNITLDMETVGLTKEKGVFYGEMDGQKIVGKYLANQQEFKRLDHFICQNSSRRVQPNQPCDVSWDVLHSHLAKRAALDVRYIRNDLHKVAQKEASSLSIALCASDRFMGELKEVYGLSRWNRETSPEVATLMTSLLLNPEGLLLKFFEQKVPELQKYFPAYLGECGRMIVVAEAGVPLSEYRNASWDIRADLARQIFQMIHDFQHASPDWMVILADFSFDNFAVTPDRRIQLLDLEDISIVDKQEIASAKKLPPFKEPCNEECFVSFVSNLYQSGGKDCAHVPMYSQIMLLHACHRLLSDLESTKYLRFFYPESEKQKPKVGLLHDIPDVLEPNLSNLLFNCVFESIPGQRRQSANIIKRLLEAIGRHLTQ
ncbi:divergent protein kinase domain 2A-like [Asterias rubens]|uniref:divergent protein kinase domain 2A-like n=1 Tax=Asterias rubens TaxID=7604 RepID=UPI0014556480|nr:divergent protein kinase domain 2A-like [Asterias rubens]XP_033624897.1 divergent protein kinase domain 2A-like [Asterias rubens]